MAQLVILSLPRNEAIAIDRAARRGDQDALIRLENLFTPYREEGRELACFLCGSALPPPPERIYTNVLLDLTDAEKCVAIPLCPACGALPGPLKTGRILKIFRAMQKAKTVKELHLSVHRH
jgi:hypothetical protein